MHDGTAAVHELIAEAVSLVDGQVGRPVALLALVHDELESAAADCDDPAAVADARDILVVLERAILGSDAHRHLPIAS